MLEDASLFEAHPCAPEAARCARSQGAAGPKSSCDPTICRTQCTDPRYALIGRAADGVLHLIGVQFGCVPLVETSPTLASLAAKEGASIGRRPFPRHAACAVAKKLQVVAQDHQPPRSARSARTIQERTTWTNALAATFTIAKRIRRRSTARCRGTRDSGCAPARRTSGCRRTGTGGRGPRGQHGPPARTRVPMRSACRNPRHRPEAGKNRAPVASGSRRWSRVQSVRLRRRCHHAPGERGPRVDRSRRVVGRVAAGVDLAQVGHTAVVGVPVERVAAPVSVLAVGLP